MARSKKTSKIVEEANVRLASIKSIDNKLDLGNDITAANYAAKIENTTASLEDYNTMLSTVDEKLNLYTENERDLMDFHERILLAVGAKYGKNSNEYEKAGGTKKTDHRKPTKVVPKTNP